MLMLFALAVVLDQYLKIRSVVAFNYLLNTKAVFGLAGENNIGLITGIVFTVAILYLIFFRKLYQIPLALLLAGIMSNMVDRVIYKGVIDYWNFFGLFRFNLSDLIIVLVVIYYLIILITHQKTS
jgi:lipoprotein signal peptidase